MKWKNRLTNYNFWISIVSAVLLILQAFDINFDIAYINEIATAVLGLLVVIGIITDPTRSNVTVNTQTVEKVDASKKNEDKESKSATIEEQIIPINEKVENDTIDIQNDFKVLIAQIRHDIDEMIVNLSEAKNSSPKVEVESEIVNEIKSNDEEILPSKKVQTSYNIVN